MNSLFYQQKLSPFSTAAVWLFFFAILMSFTCGTGTSASGKTRAFPQEGLGAKNENGTLIYQNNFDTKESLVTDQLGEGSVSYTIFKDGTGSFKSYVSGASNISDGYRSEQQYTDPEYNPDEVIVEYDCYFENWKDFGHNNGHVVQWHPITAGASATLAIYAFTGKFQVVRNINDTNFYQPDTLKSIAPDTWYKLRFEVKWSQGKDGYAKVFIDNMPYYSFTGRTADDNGTPYFKIGQNRWNVTESSSVYYDNLKIYKK